MQSKLKSNIQQQYKSQNVSPVDHEIYNLVVAVLLKMNMQLVFLTVVEKKSFGNSLIFGILLFSLGLGVQESYNLQKELEE